LLYVLDGDANCGTSFLDSSLPLCLSLCISPKGFYAQLEATSSVPLPTHYDHAMIHGCGGNFLVAQQVTGQRRGDERG